MSEPPAVHLKGARTEEQLAVMKQIEQDGVDPFDWNILANYHKQPILKKGSYWLVSPSEFPYEGTELHLLIIHRERLRSMNELTGPMWVEFGETLAWVEKAHGLTHGALLIRFGEASRFTGATVDHLHAHVIVGASSDAGEKIKVKVGYAK